MVRTDIPRNVMVDYALATAAILEQVNQDNTSDSIRQQAHRESVRIP